jgi:hypothetical protein
LVERKVEDYEASISLTVSELSRSLRGKEGGRYSNELLMLLAGTPDEILEANKILRATFVGGSLGARTVREGITMTRNVLAASFPGSIT